MLRIIDANCNRIGEGLRFLEEIARFLLNDDILTRELKTMRHSMVTSLTKIGVALLSERDSERDVGADIESISKQQDILSLVTANAKRVQEALRVIEELSKLPEISTKLDSREFERTRFNLYTLEQRLFSKILRKQKTTLLTGLYVILDTQMLEPGGELETLTKVIKGDAHVIQLRDKHHRKGELLEIARKIKDICNKSDTLFIINDHLDIALAADADGLHIGKGDLPLPVVRRELPIDKIVGVSTSNLTAALKAEAEGADYISVGSIFPTTTKQDAVVIGLEQLHHIKQKVPISVVAIGGINKNNIGEVISAGADSIAVISAVLTQQNVEEATRQLVKEIERKTEIH